MPARCLLGAFSVACISELRARRQAAAPTGAAFTRATPTLARAATAFARTTATFAGASSAFTPATPAAFTATCAAFAPATSAAFTAAATGAGVRLAAPSLLRTQAHRRQDRAADSEDPQEEATTIHSASAPNVPANRREHRAALRRGAPINAGNAAGR